MRVVEAGRGQAAVTVPAEGNGNHIGVIYAAQFTAAEILGGIIGLTTVDRAKYFPLVKNVDVKFVGMARSEIRAQAALDEETIARIGAEAAQRGKADFPLEAVVTAPMVRPSPPVGISTNYARTAGNRSARCISTVRTIATMSSAGTSPIRWPRSCG